MFSITPAKSAGESGDSIAALKAAVDSNAQLLAHRRAQDTAIQRIDEARRSGASLYFTYMDPQTSAWSSATHQT